MHIAIRSAPRGAACAVLALAAWGCSAGRGGAGQPMPEDARVITAAQIERTGARNAWEALQRTGNHLQTTDGAGGEPRRLTWRGHSSLQLSAAPLIYIDGSQTVDFRHLRDIPGESIDRILIYNGISGTKYFGTGGGNGVIVVRTRSGAAGES